MSSEQKEKEATLESHYGEGKDFNQNADDDGCCRSKKQTESDQEKTDAKTCCGCASARSPQPGKDLSAKAIYERAIYLNVTAKNRKCRDVCCIVLYTLFVIVWIAIAVIAFHFGDWQAILYGKDYKGRVCGTQRAASNGVEAYNFVDKKRIYYPRIKDDLIEYVAELGGDISSFDVSNIDFTKFSFSELSNISLTGVCVPACPTFGSIICKDSYTDKHGSPKVEDVTQCYGGDLLFGLIKNTYYYTHLELCSNCWATALNSTEILYRCLDVEWTTTNTGAKCVFPDSGNLQKGDTGYIGPYDSGCITREVDSTDSKLQPGYDVGGGRVMVVF